MQQCAGRHPSLHLSPSLPVVPLSQVLCPVCLSLLYPTNMTSLPTTYLLPLPACPYLSLHLFLPCLPSSFLWCKLIMVLRQRHGLINYARLYSMCRLRLCRVYRLLTMPCVGITTTLAAPSCMSPCPAPINPPTPAYHCLPSSSLLECFCVVVFCVPWDGVTCGLVCHVGVTGMCLRTAPSSAASG